MKRMLILSALMLGGCASPYQKVFIDGDQASNMPCTLANDLGEWHLTTPAWVTVKNSPYPLAIECSKPGYTFRAEIKGPNYGGNAITRQMVKAP